MFKIVNKPEFTHTVPVLVPVDGGYDSQSLKVRYRVVPADELARHDFASPEGTEAYLRAIVVRFEDVVDEDGNHVPHSDQLMTQLLGVAYIRMAVMRAYTEAMSKARLGN
jgi:hypothetical protein